MDKSGDCHDLPPKIFCLTVPKTFVGEPILCFRNFQVSDNFKDITETFRRGTDSVFQKFSSIG